MHGIGFGKCKMFPWGVNGEIGSNEIDVSCEKRSTPTNFVSIRHKINFNSFITRNLAGCMQR